jgi:hypothetical protein
MSSAVADRASGLIAKAPIPAARKTGTAIAVRHTSVSERRRVSLLRSLLARWISRLSKPQAGRVATRSEKESA